MLDNFPFSISEINISQKYDMENNHNLKAKNSRLEKEIFKKQIVNL